MESTAVGTKRLNTDELSPLVRLFNEQLRTKIVGQERAVRTLTGLYQLYMAGLNQPNRPIGTILFLGPTGTGKTRVVEAAAEILFGDPYAMVKVDCAEFQHSHEIAKLIGSPPGYLGHRETEPAFTQKRIDCFQTAENQLTFLLFDEIEKASDSLWLLLLGILDKATLTLGDNRRIDFSRCIICMTSNLGAREMESLVSTRIGFSAPNINEDAIQQMDDKIYHAAVSAARRKFSPEFMNRIDKTVVFRPLREEQLAQILLLELRQVQERLLRRFSHPLNLKYTNTSKKFILGKGADLRYGARHLKRAIERFVIFPIANLIATGQIREGDEVLVDLDVETNDLFFTKTKESPYYHSRAGQIQQREYSSQSFIPQITRRV